MSFLRFNKKSLIVISVLLMVCFVAGCGGGTDTDKSAAGDKADTADKVYTLKAGHVLAPDHPYNLGLVKMAEIMEEKSGGRLKMDVFPSSQIGNERDLIEGMQMGTVDIALTSTAPLAGFVNEFLAYDLPFLFKDRETAIKVLDGEIGQESLDQIADSGLIGLSFWENGYFNIQNSKKPVKHPQDMKGLKIRTMENEVHMATFKALGSNPIPMAWGDAVTAMQQNAIDGCTLTPISYWTSSLQDAGQKYLTLTNHVYIPAPLLMSKKTYDSLPADLQTIIKEAAIEARDYERDLNQGLVDKHLANIKGVGTQIIEVDQEEWRKALLPVYDEFVPSKIDPAFMKKIEAANNASN